MSPKTQSIRSRARHAIDYLDGQPKVTLDVKFFRSSVSDAVRSFMAPLAAVAGVVRKQATPDEVVRPTPNAAAPNAADSWSDEMPLVLFDLDVVGVQPDHSNLALHHGWIDKSFVPVSPLVVGSGAALNESVRKALHEMRSVRNIAVRPYGSTGDFKIGSTDLKWVSKSGAGVRKRTSPE